MGTEFFISRAGQDAQWAQWIGHVLEEAGYSVILQDWDFRPGEDFVAKMDQAMRSTQRTIAILSRHYELASYTVPEWTHAIAQDPTGQQAKLILVRVDNILPEGIFKARIFIDLLGAASPDEARRRILEGVRRGRQKGAPVTFPGATLTARFPGGLPPIWGVPSERNPIFLGRERELAEVVRRFSATEPPPHAVALVGMGGVGKTAIAVEHAHRQRDYYKVVWWIRGERRETVAADLALLADKLGISDEQESLGVRVEAARSWLADHDRWLLIIDDATTASIVRQAIPPGGGGHVLLTSRFPAWRRTAAVIDVAPMGDNIGAEIVSRRSGLPNDASLGQLSRALGGLPVALELAGAFLETQGLAAREYMQRLRKRGGLPFDDPSYRPPDYQVPLEAVWSESFTLLQAESTPAGDLLRLTAYLAPDEVPRSALMRGASRLPATLLPIAEDANDLRDLLAKPRALSLLATGEHGFSMHRLVQATLRQSLSEANRKRWAGDAVAWVEHVLPRQVEEDRLWHRTGPLIGHALAAAEHGLELTVEGSRTVILLDRGATYLAATGASLKEVSEARENTMACARRLPNGPPSWLLNNQAVWLISQGNDIEAERLLHQAVDAARKTEGGNAPALGVYLTNLGALLNDKDELVAAQNMLLRAVSVLDRQPVTEKSATAHSLLGQVMFATGNMDGAASQFSDAVRRYEITKGVGSLEAITARGFLAQARGEDPNNIVVRYSLTPESIAAEEGRLLSSEPAWRGEAEQLLRSALLRNQAGAAVELAALLRADTREAEADQIMDQACAAGDAEALYWRSRELVELRSPIALSYLQRSIAAGNIFSYYDLGLLLANSPASWKDAESAFRCAIEGGFDIALNDLGILLCEWPGREAEGEAILQHAGQRGQARAWANLASHYRQKNRPLEAVTALRAAADSGYLRAYGRLAFLLEELGRLSEALHAFRSGVEAGDIELRPYLQQFMERHPGVMS